MPSWSNWSMHLRRRFLITIFITAAVPCWGQDKSFEQHALDAGDSIARGINKGAEYIDLTLAGRKYTHKPNDSKAVITQLLSLTEGGQVRKSTDFSLNLKLPNVERRWQLRFTSYDEDKESRDLTQQRVRTRARERDYGAGLLFLQKLGRVRTAFIPRLMLKDPLEMSYILRFESDVNMAPVFFKPRVDLYADPKKGTGEFVQLEFRADITSRLDVAFQNTEEYRANENFFSTQHGLSFDYSLTPTQGLGWGVNVSSNNKPKFHLDDLTLSTAYGQQIYPDRLKYALTPFLLFAKSERFKGKVGISLTADLTF